MADTSYIGRTDLVRGLRNNNPGNIKTGIAWEGAVGDDGTFIIFNSIPWGVRALASDIATKISKDGLVTIRQIISKYAPPTENVTTAYIQSVSDDTGYDPDQTLPMTTDMLHRMIRAIANHELGEQQSYDYLSDADIEQGISMMNDTLSSFFQAVGVAVFTAVSDGEGNVQWGKILAITAVIGLGIYFWRKSN